MQPVFSIEQSRSFDNYLIEEIGIPSLVLMENVARQTLDAVTSLLRGDQRVLLFAGVGNNGGDGIALARLLYTSGISINLQLVGDRTRLSKDAAAQLLIAEQLFPGKIHQFSEDSISEEWRCVPIIVDAILGSGATGALRGNARQAVETINRIVSTSATSKVVSIDIPTGSNDEESDLPLHVSADLTVAAGTSKLLFYRGIPQQSIGALSIASLGYPATFMKDEQDRSYLVERGDVIRTLPKMALNASKYSNGSVLALCGSRGMTGAAIMAASSALRAGCGLVSVAVPKSERPLVAQAMPELMTIPLAEQKNGGPDISAWPQIEPDLNKADVVLLGCGMRAWPTTKELLLKIISEINKPMVIDAGALGALIGNLEVLKKRTAATVLTPHSGEIAKLVEMSSKEVDKDRRVVARNLAMGSGVIVVMKGSPTYTIDTNGTSYINSTGNSGLATAGTGDILAGIIAGMLARAPHDAITTVRNAVFLHGLAGDFAAQCKTMPFMTATDVRDSLSSAFSSLEA